MAKTSAEFEKEFIETVKAKTGNTLEQWTAVIRKKGLSKQMQIISWLKDEHNMNHLQASLLAGVYLNNGKPVYQDENNLLGNQFAKATAMRPLFDKVSSWILKNFPGTVVIAKKTYISFTEVREFAAVNIKPTELRLGMDLGEIPFNDLVQKLKLTGPMPRISHTVVITNVGQLDKLLDPGSSLIEYLQTSYNRCHKK